MPNSKNRAISILTIPSIKALALALAVAILATLRLAGEAYSQNQPDQAATAEWTDLIRNIRQAGPKAARIRRLNLALELGNLRLAQQQYHSALEIFPVLKGLAKNNLDIKLAASLGTARALLGLNNPEDAAREIIGTLNENNGKKALSEEKISEFIDQAAAAFGSQQACDSWSQVCSAISAEPAGLQDSCVESCSNYAAQSPAPGGEQPQPDETSKPTGGDSNSSSTSAAPSGTPDADPVLCPQGKWEHWRANMLVGAKGTFCKREANDGYEDQVQGVFNLTESRLSYQKQWISKYCQGGDLAYGTEILMPKSDCMTMAGTCYHNRSQPVACCYDNGAEASQPEFFWLDYDAACKYLFGQEYGQKFVQKAKSIKVESNQNCADAKAKFNAEYTRQKQDIENNQCKTDPSNKFAVLWPQYDDYCHAGKRSGVLYTTKEARFDFLCCEKGNSSSSTSSSSSTTSSGSSTTSSITSSATTSSATEDSSSSAYPSK